ncbi:LysR family transcriptional regulator [Paraferrimonas haliotis]|uniref:LysR family transcriptional regulator n=1 Tax=Paraferrimonas haliotis TaxID=2013866 RepID=UPI000BA9AFB3|nr:LysR family transcriptional regulator [Paraferrimonas haliotis]
MYRARVTLEQWRILQAVVDYGGYAHAAKALNKSQSSLNHAVAKMQSQLGIPLLEVVGRKAQLTEHGETLLRRSRELSYNAEAIELLAQQLQSEWEQSLHLFCEQVYPNHHLLDVLEAFHLQSQGTQLVISHHKYSQSYAKELSSSLEITSQISNEAIAEPLCNSELLLVCHRSHELAQLPQPLLENELASHLRIQVEKLNQLTGVKRVSYHGQIHSQSEPEYLDSISSKQIWVVDNYHEMVRILMRGLGYAWLPKPLAQSLIERKHLFQLQLSGCSHLLLPIYLIVNHRDLQGPASRILESIILRQHSDQ